MEDRYSRSTRSYSYASNRDDMMQIERYRDPAPSYELRSYSASYGRSRMDITAYNYDKDRDSQLKKGKTTSGPSLLKSWSLADPEFQRKKRVAGYKMYGVEGNVKGSLRKSFRWLKDRYTRVVHGWW